MKNKKIGVLTGAALLSGGLALAGAPTIPPTPGVENNKKITSDQVYTTVSDSPDSTLNTTSLFVENKPTQAEISATRREAYYETVPYVANIVYADGTVTKKALEGQIDTSDEPISYIKTFLAKQKDVTVSIKENSTGLNIFVFKKVGDSLYVTIDNDGKMRYHEIDLQNDKLLSKKEKDLIRLAYKLILNK